MKGVSSAAFIPGFKQHFWSNTFIAGPTEIFFFKIQKESWESNSLSWVPSINLNTFLVTELPSSSSPFAPWLLLFPCLLAAFLFALFVFFHSFFFAAPFFALVHHSFSSFWTALVYPSLCLIFALIFGLFSHFLFAVLFFYFYDSHLLSLSLPRFTLFATHFLLFG